MILPIPEALRGAGRRRARGAEDAAEEDEGLFTFGSFCCLVAGVVDVVEVEGGKAGM